MNVIPYYLRARIDTGRIGVRAAFTTGAIKHEATLTADDYSQNYWYNASFLNALTTNIYAPVALAPLVTPIYPNEAPPPLEIARWHSVALADVATLGKFTLIAGARRQYVDDREFDQSTGLVASDYAASALTPAFAALYKINRRVSVYGNFIEALEEGPTAPSNALNANEIFPPAVDRQYEAGSKFDLGAAGLTLALFQITQQSGTLDPTTNIFGLNGRQRNRGIELNAFGQIARGLRVLGGVQLMEGVQTDTAGGLTNGFAAQGVPNLQINAGVERDVPGVKGLTLTARTIFTSKQFVDVANSQSIPPWSRFDVGLRYARNALALRLGVDNVTNASFWQSALGGGLSVGAPRTVRLALSLSR